MTRGGTAIECEPYRVEWRPDLTCSWALLSRQLDHDAARAAADEALKKWEGQVRIVTQHTIEAKGLGA